MSNTINLMQTIAALRIETTTDMKHSRGSVLKHAQRTFGVTSRTKKGALEELEQLFRELRGRDYGKKGTTDD